MLRARMGPTAKGRKEAEHHWQHRAKEPRFSQACESELVVVAVVAVAVVGASKPWVGVAVGVAVAVAEANTWVGCTERDDTQLVDTPEAVAADKGQAAVVGTEQAAVAVAVDADAGVGRPWVACSPELEPEDRPSALPVVA